MGQKSRGWGPFLLLGLALLSHRAHAGLCPMDIIKLAQIDPQGGDWCYSEATCALRHQISPQYMTSDGSPGVASFGGMFDDNPEKSPWAGANKFYVNYCSSDAWLGDIPATDATWGWAFRGARIYSAAIQSIVQLHGMGSTEGARILIAGCSAGARGTMFTIDYVPAMLHQLGVANFELVTLLDSPLWVDIDPITGPSGSIIPLMEQTQIILNMLNATYRLGPTCQVAYPEDEWWKCLYGQYRLPFVETPYILNAAQFDNFQVPYNEGANPPYDAAQKAYASEFQQAVLEALSIVPNANQQGSGVFSSACFHHCVTQETDFWGIQVNNVSFRDVASEWYFKGVAPIRVIERCSGFRCGQCRSHRKDPGAPPDPKHPPKLAAPTAVTATLVPATSSEAASAKPKRSASENEKAGGFLGMSIVICMIAACFVRMRRRAPPGMAGHRPSSQSGTALEERAVLVQDQRRINAARYGAQAQQPAERIAIPITRQPSATPFRP